MIGVGTSNISNSSEFTLLTSAARTAQVDSSDMSNSSGRGLIVIVKVTADPALAAITPNILMKDVITGDDVTIWTAASTIAATGTFIYQLCPGAINADFDGTESVSIALPRTWIFRMTVADTDSMTYSVAGSYIP